MIPQAIFLFIWLLLATAGSLLQAARTRNILTVSLIAIWVVLMWWTGLSFIFMVI